MIRVLCLLLLLVVPGVASAETSFAGRQPVLASNGKLIALALGREDGVYFAKSTDGGRTFSEPAKVAQPGKLALGMRRGPRIAFVGSTIVITAIAGEKGGGADGDLFAWRSTDEGRTWSPGVRVNDVAGSAREGLHDLAADGKSALAVAWLDLRMKGTRIYTAMSSDGGKTWGTNRLAYESPTGSTCECCHPSVAIGSNGDVAVMFRNQIRSSTASDALPVRDMYLARATGDGSFAPAAKLGKDSWPLAGCPMDGGDLAFDAKGEPITIWRRQTEIFLARPGQAEQSLGAGQNPVLALSRQNTYAAWLTTDGIVVRDLAVSVQKQGQNAAPIATVAVPGAKFPVLLANGGALVLAYERDGQAIVRVVDSVTSSARR
jgi:hypothetical protein